MQQTMNSCRFLQGDVPSERFLAFNECLSGVSGENIANDILVKLDEWQLQPHLLRGQAKLSQHFHSSKGKKFHQAAVEKALTFVSLKNNPKLAIDHRLNSERSKLAAKYRLKLQSIVETVIFLGRQGLSFRGHRDDSPAVEEDPCANHGNFHALLLFRVQAGDRLLEDHLKTSAGNALYTKTIQNELISICGGER